jgi:hypothetical protein
MPTHHLESSIHRAKNTRFILAFAMEMEMEMEMKIIVRGFFDVEEAVLVGIGVSRPGGSPLGSGERGDAVPENERS